MPRYFIQDDVQYDVLNLPSGFIVNSDLVLSCMGLSELPDLTTVEVRGNLYLDHNNLTSLIGAPAKIGRSLFADHNRLKTLQGCPQIVPMLFSVDYNNLETLEHGPIRTKGYNCRNNFLQTLHHIAQNQMICLDCRNNRLTSLKYAPFMVNTAKYSGNKIPIKSALEYETLLALYHDVLERGLIKTY